MPKLITASCVSVTLLHVLSSCKPDCEEMDVELGQEVGRWPELGKRMTDSGFGFSVSGFLFRAQNYQRL